MKYSCEVIKDLLPLYIDGCCSPKSRQLVEEHLEECLSCKLEWEKAADKIFSAEEIEKQEERETIAAHTMKKGLKKITRVWLLSLFVAILLVPMCILGWNQARGVGISFTNLKELWTAHMFVNSISEGDYEKAFQYLSIESVYESFRINWFDEEDLVNLEADAKDIFLECAQALDNAGGITDYRFESVYSINDGCYRIGYVVTIDETMYELELDVDTNGVSDILTDGKISEPLPLTVVSLWREYLWEKYAEYYLEPDEQGNVRDKSGVPTPIADYQKYLNE